jgi:RNA polymerase sigma-70 factor (ECF subfamily)
MSFFQRSSRYAPAAPPDDTDERLLARIGAADRHALAELYRGWHRRLSRYLSRQTRRQDLIDEVINDTFLVVWQKAADFRGDARASTWIMGIAYRCMLKNLRQAGAPPAEASLEDFGLSAAPDEAHELRDWLNKGLSRLSPEQRDALELAYCLGHSLEEIAEITGCQVSTIKARMFHARIKLGNVLRTLGGERSAP